MKLTTEISYIFTLMSSDVVKLMYLIEDVGMVCALSTELQWKKLNAANCVKVLELKYVYPLE